MMMLGKLKLAILATVVALTAGVALYAMLGEQPQGSRSGSRGSLPTREQASSAGALELDASSGTALVRGGTPVWIAAPGEVDPGAQLGFAVSLPAAPAGFDDARLRLSAWNVAAEQPREVAVSDLTLRGDDLRRGRREFRVRMPVQATGKTLLRFTVTEPDGEPAAPSTAVAVSGLTISNHQPATSGSAESDAGSPRRPPNILIYVIDALRPDHLGCYGYGQRTSPHIDRLAAGAVVFRQAYSVSSWTRPAAASLMTGLLPSGHGVQSRQDVLGERYETIGEMLRARGYGTACVTTNGNMGSEFGFDQGWDRFVMLPGREASNGEYEHVRSGELTRKAIDVLDDLRSSGKPWLMLAWAVDPHLPYTPPAAERALFAPKAPPGQLTGDLRTARLANGGRIPITAADIEYMTALYDAEIRENDRSLGQLLDHLRRRGLFDNTLIIVLADHGEQLAEHRQFDHAHTLYEQEIRIPLVVKFPRARRVHGEVSVPVSMVDVVPTVMSAIGAPAPSLCAGEDLARIAAGDDARASTRDIVCELMVLGRQGPERAAIIGQGRWKLQGTFVRPVGSQGNRVAGVELYDLTVGEDRSVARAHPLVAKYYESRLGQIRTRQLAIASKRAGARIEGRAALKQETIRNLRALGYVQ
jgi:choline-sulfatase